MLKYQFQFSWIKLILTIIALSLFISLAFWQLNRAEEKASMLRRATLAASKPATNFILESSPYQYQKLKLSGSFLPIVLLLDNQYYNHNFGYEVLSPLQISKQEVVLVDRGWVQGDFFRNLPKISTPTHNLTVIGQVYYPSQKSWILGQEFEVKSLKMALIEKINPEHISQFLHKSVYPFIIRLNKEENYGFIRDWKIISLAPSKHKAYAFQWLAISFTIFIIYLVLSIKKANENKI